jgi:hypothetical protein
MPNVILKALVIGVGTAIWVQLYNWAGNVDQLAQPTLIIFSIIGASLPCKKYRETTDKEVLS